MKKYIKKYSFVLFFCVIFLPHQFEKAIIVLTGQSNMARSAPYITKAMPEYTVVNCAKGGTSVAQWQRGAAVYQNCVTKLQGRKVVAIFHFQGERDSYDEVVAPQWTMLTQQFFDDFREDTNSPGAKIVFAQLGTPPTDRERPYWRSIQSQQANLERNDPTITMVRTYNITPYCPIEGPHWCGAGYIEISKLFVNNLRKLKWQR